MEFERIVLLLASNAKSCIDAAEIAEKEADKIAKQLSNEQSVSISFSGALCDDISKIPEAFCEIASANGYKSKQKESNIKEHLKAYVNLHFTDPQISLTAVADEFRITEVYLSRLFKQITGENFSKYIEKMRMNEASRLIELGGLTRNEIAIISDWIAATAFHLKLILHLL